VDSFNLAISVQIPAYPLAERVVGTLTVFTIGFLFASIYSTGV